jgi:hypothetical protein
MVFGTGQNPVANPDIVMRTTTASRDAIIVMISLLLYIKRVKDLKRVTTADKRQELVEKVNDANESFTDTANLRLLYTRDKEERDEW